MRTMLPHAPKFVFAIVLTACIVFVRSNSNPVDIAMYERLRHDCEIIDGALRRRYVPPEYEYSKEAASRLIYNSALARLDSIELPITAIPQYVVYQRAARPPVLDTRPGIVTRDEYAQLAAVASLKCSADPGSVTIEFALNGELKHMTLTHVEVFRSSRDGAFDSRSPYSVIACKGGSVPTSFIDANVNAGEIYRYALRAVGEMTARPGTQLKGMSAESVEVVILREPKGLARLEEAAPITFIFVSALTEPVAVAVPPMFKIRLAGTVGKIPESGIPSEFTRAEYKGNFAISVWIPAVKEWKEIILHAGPGQRLAGALLYKNRQTKQNESHTFDTGFQVSEIKWGEIRRTTLIDEAVLAPDGTPLLDPILRKPLTQKRERISDPIPNEVAVLKNAGGKIEEFPKQTEVLAAKPARTEKP